LALIKSLATVATVPASHTTGFASGESCPQNWGIKVGQRREIKWSINEFEVVNHSEDIQMKELFPVSREA